MYATCKANLKKGNEKYESSWNRCSGKRKYVEQLLKMTKERYWMNSSLVMMEMEYAISFQDTVTWKLFY